jgi:glucan phosphoethanolaminetransferase (alkaline phosphatase superfamily)
LNKTTLVNFSKVIFSLFIISTIAMLFIVYKNINHPLAKNFGIYYLYLTFFIVIFTPIIVIIKIRKLKWIEIKNRLIKFIALFILLGSLNFILDYFFKPGDIDLVKNLTLSFGFSFGISFLDVLFLSKKD